MTHRRSRLTLTPLFSMAIGAVGYTAMLSVLALEHGGLASQRGDILVTGANGDVL
jgi:acrylyl-CoA reductase (NADPH)